MPAAADLPWTTIAVQAASGMTLKELSEHWGVPLGTLQSRSATEGWMKYRKPVQQDSTKRALEAIPKLGEKSKFRAARVGHRILGAIGKHKNDALIACSQPFAQTVGALAKVHGWGSESTSQAPLIAIQLNGYVPPESQGAAQ